jgi:hypothetical protein
MSKLVELVSKIVVVQRVVVFVSGVDWLAIVDDDFSDVHSSICANQSSVNTLAKCSGLIWILKEPKNMVRELSAANSNNHIRFSITENIFASNIGRFEEGLVVANHMLM